MKVLVLTIILFSSLLGFSQDQKVIDSLKNVVSGSANDSLKMDAYNKLRRATYYSDAKASKNYTYKYLEFAQKRKDSHHIVLAHFFLGNANVLSADYDEALKNYLIGADYYERKKDSARLTSVLNSLGAVHEKTKNDSLSLYYYKQARAIGKKLKDYRRSGIASVNIGNIYNNQGKLNEAVYYLEDSVKDLETNEKYQSFLTLAQINLAGAYGKQKKYNQALSLYNLILKKIDTINNQYNYAGVLRGKSNILLQQNRADKALPIALKAYNKYSENNFADEHFQMMPELIEIYKALGKNKEAVNIYENYLLVKDSRLTIESDKNIADAIQKYETEKKDAQLKVLALENEKAEQQQRLYFFIALAGLLIAGLIGFFLYKNQKKNKLLAKQKALLEATVDEKNVLLKETHHRVKNSFQIVSSLLYLQSENIEDKEAQLAIKEAQNRVRSMVLIHQKLYSKDQLVGIDTKEYFTDLTNDIFESHQFQDQAISHILDIEPMVLGIETITPLGLILNELITNVLKHAFHPITQESKMSVIFKKQNDTLVLEVADNGKGIPTQINESSFGIQLMRSLAKKLKGKLKYLPNHPKGTVAFLEMNRYKELV